MIVSREYSFDVTIKVVIDEYGNVSLQSFTGRFKNKRNMHPIIKPLSLRGEISVDSFGLAFEAENMFVEEER